jgi:hypothetical protein
MADSNRPNLQGISGADAAALADLWLHWGSRYRITRPLRGQWIAIRRGSSGPAITAHTAGELRKKLIADRTAVTAAGGPGG